MRDRVVRFGGAFAVLLACKVLGAAYTDPQGRFSFDPPEGWVNNLGEYVLSESPSFNPNIGSNLSWRQIRPVR